MFNNKTLIYLAMLLSCLINGKEHLLLLKIKKVSFIKNSLKYKSVPRII